MERVRPKKKIVEGANKANIKVDSGLPSPTNPPPRPAPRPTELRRDLTEQPFINLAGYGKVVKADMVGPVALSYREQPYDDFTKTRLYYVGRLLIGTACFSALNIVVYLRGASATEYLKFQTEKELHQQLALLLKATP